ncbi:MAG: glycosyltransferase family 2 protein [Pseudomonadota bacterium]|nr:glycosyltransferase family 2 protein [Gammaproteobacteria bacterium]MBU1558221.1 glycosyltransferase family 2 protein [Gammaproteobacteria bacterium]MBU1927016.1 glycosyltransferase family 2 protein [Gammaproteobacteria bacterium]MBU2546212.1 glycosyltransferase family 2 protein [Gammaproteobacteria bacterium]
MKLISVVTPCYNEEGNVQEVYERVRQEFAKLPNYRYEHIFIDNASTDRTVAILKAIATKDKNVKIIVNARNFGHIRSPFYGLLQAQGDAVISLVSDLQDPPELIQAFIQKWEEGYKVVAGVKPTTKENKFMASLRRIFYRFISKISEMHLIQNFTGFGLYDQSIIAILRTIEDPYPYFRGLISEIGFDAAEVPFEQPVRKHGKTKNNFYTLYDIAMLGITSHSKLPIRLATFLGFTLSVVSFLISLFYLIFKLIFWNRFGFGLAPVLIGLFFFASVQLFFIGLVGEYIASIHTQVMKRPLVVERERINFDEVDRH